MGRGRRIVDEDRGDVVMARANELAESLPLRVEIQVRRDASAEEGSGLASIVGLVLGRNACKDIAE